MPARQSSAWAGIKDDSDATWGAHKDASDSAGDARPKGRSGHRPGQGPRPLELKTQVETQQAGAKQPHSDEEMGDAAEAEGGGDLPGEHHQHEQAQKGKRPPHSSKRAWEGRAMLPKKKEKGPAYMEPTAPIKPVRDDFPRGITSLPEWPEASWWNERFCRRQGERWEAPGARILPWELLDVPDLLKRVAHKKTNFQYWLSINPAEQKQHVKRYPKDTGVPVPQECHDWVKTCFVLVQNREPPAEGGDTGTDKAADGGDGAPSRGVAQAEGCKTGGGERPGPPPPLQMLNWETQISPRTLSLMCRTARKLRVMCPPREAHPWRRSGGGLKSATLWAIGASSRRSCEATWG